MLISTDLHPLKIDYPLSKNLPKNLIDTPYKEDFRASSKKFHFENNMQMKHAHISLNIFTINMER